MGTECFGPHIGDGESGRPSPDGIISLTSFTLKRIHNEKKIISVSLVDTSLVEKAEMDSPFSTNKEEQFTRCLKRKPWINYGMIDVISDEDCESELFNLDSSRHPLPKGVTRGCSSCNNCQTVVSRWHPEAARRPILNEAPVFYPNEEEFKDALKYIASISQMVEPYGICRIIPPLSWKPPCPLKEKHLWRDAKFATQIQQLEKLQTLESIAIHSKINYTGGKQMKHLRSGIPCSHGDAEITDIYQDGIADDRFALLPGPEFTLESFRTYADGFIEQYFCMDDSNTILSSRRIEGIHQHKPSVDEMEGEYWRVIEEPTEEIEVLYGADLDTGAFGSGFPKACCSSENNGMDAYARSGWNLNNLPRLAGSMLSFVKSDTHGILVPRLHIGMCFSSCCWHVDDHHLYSLSYMHWGDPKLWYGIPGSHALKMEAVMKNHLPDLFEDQSDLLHKLVIQLSPAALKSEGLPVYRCVQHSGEFVLTFPRAYHSGFNCGFNCVESANVAPVDWLPHGQSAVELYSLQHRKTSISHDKLLLCAACEAIRALWEIHFLRKETPENLRWQAVCGKDGILTMALQTRVDIERAKRQFLCNPAQVRRMDVNCDATAERECAMCYYDLYLSAVSCECSPKSFACLNHAKQLCSCAWSRRIFLYRYEITDLEQCIEALGGKWSAIHRWANEVLGLYLSSQRKGNI